MELEKLKRKQIKRLKQIKQEQGLSISQIMDLMEKQGKFVSEGTLKKVFADGSEEKSFRYQDSIAPVADVLLDIYGDTSGLDDVESLRQIIHEKNKLIEFLVIKLEECADEAKTVINCTKIEKLHMKRLFLRLIFKCIGFTNKSIART